MKWVRFAVDGEARYGFVEGNEVIEVEGSPFGEYQKTGNTRPLEGLKYLIPFEPKQFYAAGLNYGGHAIAKANAQGELPKLPTQADIGYRGNNSLIPHDAAICIPHDASERVQYEGELVVVIGKQAKRVSQENALDYVVGYTIGNDVSERTWQKGDRTIWRGKNTDTFAPMGPFLVTDFDLGAAQTIVRVNGDEQLRFDTKDMLFGVREFISRMSQYMTLYPGDMIWMGTDGKGENLGHGDVVEVEITGIGTLRNPVIREVAPE